MTTVVAGGTRRKGWTIALWVVQILLAILYVTAGGMKLTQPMADLAAMNMKWATSLPESFVRFLGAMEILGALGLILTPIAAAGLSLVQVSAIVLHATRGETAMTLPLNLALLALSLFVLWGRWSKAPIQAR